MINLIEITKDKQPFGTGDGKRAFEQLRDYVDQYRDQIIFGISLAGIEATDASFARESVVALAKLYAGEKGFFLQDFSSRDLKDNWDYAARARDFPLVIWTGDQYEIIGKPPSSPNAEIIDFVYAEQQATTSKVASELDISVQNASTKLKKLATEGYLLRSEEAAESGGKEFLYLAVK